MSNLSNPQDVISILRKYDIHLQKKYGQNFLVDAHILQEIVRAADVGGEDFVLEIGPGIGTLTQRLCEAAGAVAAVEIDAHLIPPLQETLASYDNITIINDDILHVDVPELVRQYGDGRPARVVANLPYYITTPVILSLLEGHAPVQSITVMVQEEVAARMQTGPGSKDYGALSLAVQYYAESEVVLHVSPNCFLPQPTVGSAVIRLTLRDKPLVEVADEHRMFQLIRAAFNQRRKTLVNALANSGQFGTDKEHITDCITSIGLPATVRGEVLTLEQFAQLSDLL